MLVGDLCCNKESLNALCKEFLDAGALFLHLREFNEFMSSHKATAAGQIVEAFALAIQDFLTFYQHQVNELAKKAEMRKQEEARQIFGIKETDTHDLTLMELQVLMDPLLIQIRTVASICFTWKFIENILEQRQKGIQDKEEKAEDINFLSLLYKRNTFSTNNLQVQLEANLEKIRRKQWLEEFPRGSTLLTYLFRITLACEADLTVVELLRRIFARAVSPLLRMISDFITIGSFEDPF